MPLYTFELQDGERPVGDDTGMWFPDREHALDHAHRVARELMSARELQRALGVSTSTRTAARSSKSPLLISTPRSIASIRPCGRTWNAVATR